MNDDFISKIDPKPPAMKKIKERT